MNYRVILANQESRYNSQYTYYVIAYEDGNDVSIVYDYTPTNTKRTYVASGSRTESEIEKPTRFYFMKGNTLEDFLTYKNYLSLSANYKELGDDPKGYGLHIPETFDTEVKTITTKSTEITDEMLNELQKISNNNIFVAVGEDMSKRYAHDKYSSVDIVKYFCSKCAKTFFLDNYTYMISEHCPYCNTYGVKSNSIVLKEFKAFRKKHYNDNNYYNTAVFDRVATSKKERFYYISKHPEDANGIMIYKICHDINAENGCINNNYVIEYSIEYVVGKIIKSYKYLKKSKKECDPFEALNINTKNIQNPPTIVYENATDFFDFATQNEKFLRMSGFQATLKYSPMSLSLEPFFIVFIGIMSKYPIMEQIVKMGHARLFFNLYKSLLESLNKDAMTRAVDKISELVDNESTTGKTALRFPTYIGDYLIKKDAKLEEYYYWRDLYEITHITKEQFENLIDSFNYAWINSQIGLRDIGNILKFGYSIDKLFNLIVKQSKKYKLSIEEIIYYLNDYLTMCDMLRVKPDMYPQEIKKVHDDILVHYNNKKRAEHDKKLSLIGTECENYVIPDEDELKNVGIPKLFETMTVIFPKSENDFIEEGNQQHNCVGSYPSRVRDGQCVVFFIRYKDNPNKSFITAECISSGLGQCFYSNNRNVHEEDLIKFAKYIANKINKGCSSGKIHGLHNVN